MSDTAFADPAPPPAIARGPFQGSLDEVSPTHARGWLRDFSTSGSRAAFAVVLASTGEVLAQGVAAQFRPDLRDAGIGDGAHGFFAVLARALVGEEWRDVIVRAEDAGFALGPVARPAPAFEPLLHVAMDVVDNCNLRCPFCLFDYSETRATHTMHPALLDSALRFLPYARDGEFWFSCLHEPTLHPQLVEFIERVPAAYRRKLFFTTNLAKRMPAAYFDWLASNGMHHINVSIESRDPALYERMRKGARHRIFQENWDVLMGALERSARPTRIRYIAMAYKSNLRELPGLAAHLLLERRAWQFEIRYTFDVPHLPPEFREAEFLDAADWAWLAEQLSVFSRDRLLLILPPDGEGAAAEAAAPAPVVMTNPLDAVVPGQYMFRLSWDGALKVVGIQHGGVPGDHVEELLLQTNIGAIDAPGAFFTGLMQGRLPPAAA